jgi:hypothetical protein
MHLQIKSPGSGKNRGELPDNKKICPPVREESGSPGEREADIPEQ